MISLGQFRLGPEYVICLKCRSGLHSDMFDDDQEFELAKESFVMTHIHKCKDTNWKKREG